MKQVNFKLYSNLSYKPGRKVKMVIWYFVNAIFFCSFVPYPSKLKIILLKIFGAEIGQGVVIKPRVSIKYPWFLKIGNNSWIGESVWVDNLAEVSIGANVCISQGAYLLTGSHDYKSESFDLIVKPILIEDGAWIGAKAVVCPGVKCGSHSVLSVNSVANNDLDEYAVYQGNPAEFKRRRCIK